MQQPCIFKGEGKIVFGENAKIGYYGSPYQYSGYSQLFAMHKSAVIKIGAGTVINNNAVITSEANTIEIGEGVIIGTNFYCADSDFHSIDPDHRNDYDFVKRADVKIGNNVFMGNNVTVLKGVTIGNNCTIGANSVVSKSFPDNSVICGNPAKLIKTVSK